MSIFRCQVCKKGLKKADKMLACENNHCYDLAKQGYVNLLQTQKSSAKRHGDDKIMVKSRQEFLDKGYYKPLLDAVASVVLDNATDDMCIIDAGCGEGYYTQGIELLLNSKGIYPKIAAVDISKDSLIGASRRSKSIELAVASVFDIPVADNKIDIILNLFAPMAIDEFMRILKSGGILISVVPLERHLWNLKASIYDKPYENEVKVEQFNGFELVNEQKLCSNIELSSNEDITSLFMMTPYYYKTSKSDQQKLAELQKISVETEFLILVYRKK